MDIIHTRRFAAKILVEVLLGKLTVLEALKTFPKECADESVKVCFHILVHFESDEDIRKKDPLYKEAQDNFIVETAQTLAKGEALPVNIIQEYTDYYNDDLFYRKMTKENILKRLLKQINL
ncbi:MAG: hypothetical protein LUE64_04610 [Candidatus Gastranaerophilales bacterium]|nr:hypothetical protein [Candidatus Gastranaerophilales bacterium]